MNIMVNVDHQKIKIATNLRNLVSGTQEFVRFVFDLEDDWNDLMVFAQFKQDDVAYNVYLDEENSVYLPPEIGPGTCTLMLYGVKNTTRATTNYLTLTIDENILVYNAESTEISQSLYDQLVTRVDGLITWNETQTADLVAKDNDLQQQINNKASTAALQQEVTRAQAAEQTISDAVSAKADQSALDAEILRAQAAEQTNADAITLKADQSQVNRMALQLDRLVNNEVIQEEIAAAVEEEIEGYLVSGRLANLTIVDGSLSSEKFDSNVNATLGKADTAMQPSVYDTAGKATDIFDYADNAANAVQDDVDDIKTELESAYELTGQLVYTNIGDTIRGALTAARNYSDVLLSGISQFEVSIVNELPQEGSSNVIYCVPKADSDHYEKYIYLTVDDGEGNTENVWETIGSSSTLVVNALPQVGDPDADYILKTANGCMYYKYINNQWEIVAGSLAVIVNELPQTGNEFTDYYLKNASGKYLHYRWIVDNNVGAFQIIGSDSYTKAEVDTIVGNIRNDMGGYSDAISANTTNLQSLSNTVDRIRSDVDSIDLEGNTYYHTITKNEETDQYTLTLYQVHGQEETVASSTVLPATGGGGAPISTTTLIVDKITPSPLVITSTDSAIIEIDYSSEDEDHETYGATYTWKTGATTIMTGEIINQGRVTFDLTDYVSVGTQKFSLTVVDELGTTVVKTWTIQMVDIRLETSFSDRYTNEIGKRVSFTYTPYGAVNKTVHFILDGVEIDTINTSASGTLQSYSIPAQPHGAHLFECFITATVNNVAVETEHIYKDIIWYDSASNIPVIGCIYRNDYYHVVSSPSNDKIDDYYILSEGTYYKAPYKEVSEPNVSDIGTYYELVKGEYVITGDADIDSYKTYYVKEITSGVTYYSHSIYVRQYDTTNIQYYVYNPNSSMPVITRTADGVTTELTLTSNADVWSYQTSTTGKRNLVIACGVTSITITLDAVELGIDASPVTGGLEIDFNPTGITNSSENREWSNDNYHMTVSQNFDWANGGYKTDANGDTYFLVKSGTSVQFDYEMFAGGLNANPSVNGAEIKIVFMTENVQSPDAVWFSNVETTTSEVDGQTTTTKMGIQMGVHEGWLKTNNASDTDVEIEDGESSDSVAATNTYLYMPYSEEDIIEMDINIDTLDREDDTAQAFVMAYEDGVPSKAYVYDSGDRFYQYNPQPITIGSTYCDVRIYRMKVYSTSLGTESIMRNFIADSRDASTMLQRYDRNSIYYNRETGGYTPYSGEGVLDPERLAKVVPDVKILMLETDHFTTSKKTFVKSSLRCIHAPGGTTYVGDPYYDNWLFENGYHSGQGTTSDNYGNAGRNVDFLFNCDGTHKPSDKVEAEANYISQVTLGYNTENAHTEVCTDWKGDSGKITLTRTSVPNNFFNLKLNIASSENANNALFQKRYNDFLPYTSPAKARDPRIKNDMEFVPAILFIKETNPDTSTHNEFQDTEWHFYGLGNLGDSKKTDYTRSYDPTDINEFTIEISDNTKNNATFQTGVFLDGNGNRQIERFNIVESEEDGETIYTPVSIDRPSSYVYPITLAEWENVNNMRHWSLYNEAFDGDHSFEPRYACCGDYRDGKLVNDTGNGGKPQVKKDEDVWRAFYRWVITSTDQEFVNELDEWCVRSAMEFFYAFTHYYTLMDNRAKNTFWHFAKTGVYRQVSKPVEELLHVYCELDNDEYVTTEDTSVDPNKTYYTQYAFDLHCYDTDTAIGIKCQCQ